MSVYDDYVVAKGYTRQECNRPSTITLEKARANGFDTIEEYREALHEFLNGQ